MGNPCPRGGPSAGRGSDLRLRGEAAFLPTWQTRGWAGWGRAGGGLRAKIPAGIRDWAAL